MENTSHNLVLDSSTDSQIVADCLANGLAVPAEVAQRVKDHAEIARKRLLAAKGLQDVGVQIIRDIRGELPSP
jgi:hypothetical protein